MSSKEDDTVSVSLFTEQMRTQTKEIHDQSDRLVNLKLTFCLTSKTLYGEALGLFWPIYSYLEKALERHKGHPQLEPFCKIVQKIPRTHGFEADLDYYLGEEDKQNQVRQQVMERITKTEELSDYLQHLQELEKEDPVFLVAFAYHMYMAILSGGYVIRKIVKRTFGLTSNQGVQALTTKGTDSNLAAVRKEIKDCVNTKMSLTEKQRERILRESTQVFVRNNKLVSTLHDSPTLKSLESTCVRLSMVVFVVLVAITYTRYATTK